MEELDIMTVAMQARNPPLGLAHTLQGGGQSDKEQSLALTQPVFTRLSDLGADRHEWVLKES